MQAPTQLMEITQIQMKSLEVLADTNLKISEAKNSLFKLQQTEQEYLKEREEKTKEIVQKALNESIELLKQTKYNYEEIKQFQNTTRTFADFLEEMFQKYTEFVENFNKRAELWEEIAKSQNEEIANLRKEIENEKEINKEKEKSLKEKEKILEREKIHIQSQQATLSSSYNELKKLWNLQNKK